MSTTTDSISVQAAKEHPLPEYKPGQPIGGFEVVQKLREGLIGARYEVKDRSGKTKALTLLRSSLLRSGVDLSKFHIETQEVRTIQHPGVLNIEEDGEHDGNLFFTTEMVDGGSLRELMDSYKSKGEDVSPEDLFAAIDGTLTVLKEVHSMGLHRNLDPDNILFRKVAGADGKAKRQVVLADYGLAKLVDPAAFSDTELAREGAFYMAPELSEFQAKADPTSDLYSVSAIFYELVAGMPPVGRYLLPSEVREGEISQKIDDFVEVGLNPNPRERFQTAGDMQAAFRQAYNELFTGRTDTRRVALLLSVLIVVVIAAALYFWGNRVTPEDLQAEAETAIAELRSQHQGKPAGSGAPAVDDAKYEDMIWIPAGTYISGYFRDPDPEAAQPPASRTEKIEDVPGYWIDKYEAHLPEQVIDPEADDEETQAAKRTHNANDAWRVLSDVTFDAARGACRDAGKRLCTEDEWEKACKGPDNNVYGYGNTLSSDCPTSGSSYYKANENPKCASGYGVFNLSGGVGEWTSSRRSDGRRVAKPIPQGVEAEVQRCAGRTDYNDGYAASIVGYRCCAD